MADKVPSPDLGGYTLAQLQEIAWRLTPAAMAHTLTLREPEYARFGFPKHIEFISDTVCRAVAGRTPFVIINLPPQHSKSTTISKWTPVWFLENFPHRRVILGSYAAEFAEKWGRATRDTIEQYKGVLSVRISPKTSAAGEWETTLGGGMVSTGIGGPLTGRNGDLLIIDDPHKDAKEANSPTIRENVWEWFMSVFMTRRGPNSAVVILHTRWHPDDLTGRIKKRMAADPEFPRFEIVNLPAIAEAGDVLGRSVGDPLWPQRYDRKWLDIQKRLVGSYWWNALYGGRPSAPEGGYFKRAWFDKVDPRSVPALKFVRFWDLAGTIEGEKGNHDPDYTVGVKIGISAVGVCYITDVRRFRKSPDQVERDVKTTARQDGPRCKIRMQQDPAQAGKDQRRHYQKLLLGYDFRAYPRTLDKVTASGPFNAACERGDVKLVEGPWVEDFIEEVCAFPQGAHDDILDASVGAYKDLVENESKWDRDAVAAAFSYQGSRRNMDLSEVLSSRRAALTN